MLRLWVKNSIGFVVLVVIYLLLARKFNPGQNNSWAVASFAVSILAGLFVNWVFHELAQVISRSKGAALPDSLPADDTRPVTWRSTTQFVVLAVATVLSIWIAQRIYYSFALLLQDAKIVMDPDRRQFLLITLLGECALLFWLPTTAYVALSVGRRSGGVLPSWKVVGSAAAVGLGIPMAVNNVPDILAGKPPPLIEILGLHPPGAATNPWILYAVAFGIQLIGYIFAVTLYSLYLGSWCWLGRFLQNRGWV